MIDGFDTGDSGPRGDATVRACGAAIRAEIAKLSETAHTRGINPTLLRVVRLDIERPSAPQQLVPSAQDTARTVAFISYALMILSSALRGLDAWRAARREHDGRRVPCPAGCATQASCHLVQCARLDAYGTVSPPDLRVAVAANGAARIWLGPIAIVHGRAFTAATAAGGGGGGSDMDAQARRCVWQHLILDAVQDEVRAAHRAAGAAAVVASAAVLSSGPTLQTGAMTTTATATTCSRCMVVPLDAELRVVMAAIGAHGGYADIAARCALNVTVHPFEWASAATHVPFVVFFRVAFAALCATLRNANRALGATAPQQRQQQQQHVCAPGQADVNGCVFLPTGAGATRGERMTLFFNVLGPRCATLDVYFANRKVYARAAEMNATAACSFAHAPLEAYARDEPVASAAPGAAVAARPGPSEV